MKNRQDQWDFPSPSIYYRQRCHDWHRGVSKAVAQKIGNNEQIEVQDYPFLEENLVFLSFTCLI